MLFEAENLACRRGLRPVFRNISFALESGDALMIRGPNGSGKSSLLRIMAGLLPAAQGMIRWGGDAVDWAEHKARLHYIGHRDAVKPELTVAENLDYWRALRGTEVTPRLTSPSRGEKSRHHMLDAFSLRDMQDRPARILSAGQRRRLALARLLLADAPLWLLDEPVTSLDAAGQEILSELLARHRAKGGMAVIAAHHDMKLPGARRLSLAGEDA